MYPCQTASCKSPVFCRPSDSKYNSNLGARREILSIDPKLEIPCSPIYRVTSKTLENLRGQRTGSPIAIHSAFQFVTTLRRSGWTQGNAEAVVAAGARREVTAPERRLTKLGHDDPTATTEHAKRALPWSNGITDCTIRIRTVPVVAPFPNVPIHVVEAPGVCLLLTHRVRLSVAVAVKPSIVAQ